MKKTYFLSDAHLGSRATADSREREKKLCRFLDSVRSDDDDIYFLGDIFDFWFEYRNVVPKGFTRFLGKLSELTDEGVEVHFFTGNHDMWTFGYLRDECGVCVHTMSCEIALPLATGGSLTAMVGHGDGLGDSNRGFRLLRSIFHSPLCRWLFRNVFPPDLGMEFGLRWAKSSRIRHSSVVVAENGDRLTVSADGVVTNALGDVLARNIGMAEPFKGESEEPLVLFSKQYLREHSGTSFFIFGHRHIEIDLMLSAQSRLLVLGEWMTLFTYAIWDGENMQLNNFED